MQFSDSSAVSRVQKDSGYAWVVLFCAVYLNIVQSGTLSTYGILLPDIVETFQVSKARASSIQALAFAGNVVTGRSLH